MQMESEPGWGQRDQSAVVGAAAIQVRIDGDQREGGLWKVGEGLVAELAGGDQLSPVDVSLYGHLNPGCLNELFLCRSCPI